MEKEFNGSCVWCNNDDLNYSKVEKPSHDTPWCRYVKCNDCGLVIRLRAWHGNDWTYDHAEVWDDIDRRAEEEMDGEGDCLGCGKGLSDCVCCLSSRCSHSIVRTKEVRQ